MRVSLGLTLAGCLLLCGCGGEPVAKPAFTPPTPTIVPPLVGLPPGGFGAANAPATPAKIESGVATLSPDNTKIEFLCSHVGEKPDPRKGGFAKFAGQAEIDSDGKTLKSVSVVIETPSVWTALPPLTTHLNAPDFFDTREHPEAKFESTTITPPNEQGEATITGNLTLLKATKEISFPAIIAISDEGLTLRASFDIDRSEFGMDRLQERVEKTVALTVVIGEKTQPQQGGDAPDGAAGSAEPE